MNTTLDPFQRKLIGAFEATVPESSTTAIFFTHPKAPHLILTRSPEQPQVVPVLLAGTNLGGQIENTKLGISISLASNERLPLFQGISDGNGFYCAIAPFLFYRGYKVSEFKKISTDICKKLADDGALTSWLIVKCAISYLTKDGRFHHSGEYPEAFDEV